MSRNPDEYYIEEMEEAIARDELIAQTLKGISEDGVRGYLGAHGDAVDFRIQDSLTQANNLNQSGFHRFAIVSAVTAIELIIRFMLIRPLIQAAFLSEDWAYLLTQRIATGRTADDRKLLPHILEFHDIKVAELKLKSGVELWKTITDTIYAKRDRIVHRGESAKADDANIAIECATMLRKKVVLKVAKKMGFTLENTGCWHKIKDGARELGFSPRDPFKTE